MESRATSCAKLDGSNMCMCDVEMRRTRTLKPPPSDARGLVGKLEDRCV